MENGTQNATGTTVVTEINSTVKGYLESNINNVSRLAISKVRVSSGGARYITILDKDAPRESSATNLWVSKSFSVKLGLGEGDSPSFIKDARVCMVGQYPKICALPSSDNYESADDLF